MHIEVKYIYVLVAISVLAYGAFSVFQIAEEKAELRHEHSTLQARLQKASIHNHAELNLLLEENSKLNLIFDRLQKERESIEKEELGLVHSSVMCSVVPEGIRDVVHPNTFLDFQEHSGDVLFEVKDILQSKMGILGPTWGASWGDYNGDTFPDLLLSNHYQSTKLYLNNNGSFFQDVTIETLGRLSDTHSHSACWGDFTNDGWEDLLEVAGLKYGVYTQANHLWVNQNNSRFLDESESRGLEHNSVNNLFCFWWDYDLDGLLDVVEGGITKDQPVITISRQQANHTFADESATIFATEFTDADFVSYFYAQDRRAWFVTISKKGKIRMYNIQSRPYEDATDNFHGLKLDLGERTVVDVAYFDMDHNQRTDIILALDVGDPIILFNLRQNTFRQESLTAAEFKPKPQDLNAATTTTTITNSAIAVADFNNDMIPDVFLVRRTEHANAPNILYMSNNSTRTYTMYTTGGGAGGSALGRGDSVAVADYDVDGYMDLVITNGEGSPPFGIGPTQLFHNTNMQANNWIEIDLYGVLDNPHGIGARVTVTTANGSQCQAVGTGVHTVKSSHHRRLHFGLGADTVITNLSIWWPKAHFVQEYSGIVANQLLSLMQVYSPNVPSRVLDIVQRRGVFKMQCEAGKTRLKPNFLILGIWKAGTSSLAGTLSQHPQIKFPTAKETFYFSKFYNKLDIEWYWGLFPCGNSSNSITFEATAGYMYTEGLPQLIKKHLPEAKLIIMLRDPIERAYSHFYMNYRAHSKNMTLPPPLLFDDLVRSNIVQFDNCTQYFGIEKCSNQADWQFINAGMYYYSIQKWLAHFPMRQFLFLDFAAFATRNNSAIISDTLNFLGVEEQELPPEVLNIAGKKQDMLPSTRSLLHSFYFPHNKKVYELLGKDFGWDAT